MAKLGCLNVQLLDCCQIRRNFYCWQLKKTIVSDINASIGRRETHKTKTLIFANGREHFLRQYHP